ncbi:MAG: YraN family protein [Actinobacteria bacterium]|nr:YraN family protein [Actinomycetota bacterium]MCB9412868.1 YraN family protein [Actinomycetota bacterium]
MGGYPNGSQRRTALGRYGEDVACAFLTERGYRIVERNWRCREGELDIVALDADFLVGCEVKTRSSNAYGSPEEAVTPRKVVRLRKLLALWLAGRTPGSLACRPVELRLDVVAVELSPKGPAVVRHLLGVG